MDRTVKNSVQNVIRKPEEKSSIGIQGADGRITLK
jgi:hypothetical protein